MTDNATRLHRQLLDAVDQAIIATDLDGIIFFWNRFAEELYGWSADEVLGRNILDITPTDITADQAVQIMKTLRTGKSWTGDFLVRRRDGSSMLVMLSDFPIYDENGLIIGIIGVSVDATKRTDAKQALLERNRRLELLSETASRLLSSSHPADIINYLCRRLASHLDLEIYFNYLLDEEAGVLRLFAYGGVTSEVADEMGTLRFGQAVCGTVASERREIIVPDVQSSDDPLIDFVRSIGVTAYACHPLIAEGRLLGTLSFGTRHRREFMPDELTLMKTVSDQVATALQRAELFDRERCARADAERNAARLEQLQSVTAALSEALTSDDVAEVAVSRGIEAMGAHAGSILLLDESGTELVMVRSRGYSDDFIEPWQRIPLSRPLPVTDAVRDGWPVFVESVEEWTHRYPEILSSRRVTGSNALAVVPLIVRGRPIGAIALSFDHPREFAGDDRAFMTAIAQQCSHALERARLFESEKVARAEAEGASLAKDQFLAVLSHELRTPLTPVLVMTEVLQADESVPPELRSALDLIRRNIELEAQLINDLLDVTRITKGKLQLNLESLDLHEVLQGIGGFFQEDLDTKRLSLVLELRAAGHYVQGDRMRLQQVFWNLVKNSIKFTPHGGTITIRTANPLPALLRIDVADTGIGIEPEVMSNIFRPFEQGEKTITRRFGGLGLGLSISKALVEGHGGTIAASSGGVGKGATFTVELATLESVNERY